MKKFNSRNHYWFRLIFWGVVVFSLLMIAAAGVDIALGLRWGFSSLDLVMAIIVLLGAIMVNAIGTKIFGSFGEL